MSKISSTCSTTATSIKDLNNGIQKSQNQNRVRTKSPWNWLKCSEKIRWSVGGFRKKQRLKPEELYQPMGETKKTSQGYNTTTGVFSKNDILYYIESNV